MDCIVSDKNNANNQLKVNYISYNNWKNKSLDKIIDLIQHMIKNCNKPLAIVLEIGHFSLSDLERTYPWAKSNINFANELSKWIINKYNKDVKIVPTLLINNLDENRDTSKLLEVLFKDNKYINKKSTKIISERNLKNRAYKMIKKDSTITDNIEHRDGKAFLCGEVYQNNSLPVGFIGEDGQIIPRCGLILTSYLDKVVEFAKQRLHTLKNPNIVFVSFSQHTHEYERVKLGVDTFSEANSNLKLSAIISNWSYEDDKFLVSYRRDDEIKWN